jgi:adenosylhomocysteine nucleosidase
MTSSMTKKIRPRPVFIAALTREIATLVAQRGWRADRTHLDRKIHLFEHEDAIIACAGMGGRRATLAIEASLTLGAASELVSVGWAGASNPCICIGDVIHADIVIDAQTGERFSSASHAPGREPQILVTVAAPAGTREKERLGLTYGASVVDMEAAAVARIARARELPFYAIKAISDGATFALPDMARFTTADGQFREAAFALHLALHPRLWKSVAKLAKGSTLAAQRLRPQIEVHIQNHRERRL